MQISFLIEKRYDNKQIFEKKKRSWQQKHIPIEKKLTAHDMSI